MQIDYLNDLNHNYIIVKLEGDKEEFSVKMLTENLLPGLVPCEVRFLNDEVWLYYDISQIQSLQNLYIKRQMSEKELEELIKSWYEAENQMEDFFLSRRFLMLKPEFVFYNMETKRFLFLVMPEAMSYYCEKSDKQLLDFLITIVVHEDARFTEKLYHFYEDVQKEVYSLEKYREIYSQLYVKQDIGKTGDFHESIEMYKESKQEDKVIMESSKAWQFSYENEPVKNEQNIYTDQIKEEKVTEWKNVRSKTHNDAQPIRNSILGILFLLIVAIIEIVSYCFFGIQWEGLVGIFIMIFTSIILLYKIRKNNHIQKVKDLGVQERIKKEIEKDIHFKKEEIVNRDLKSQDDSGLVDKDITSKTVYLEIETEQEKKLYGVGKYKRHRIQLVSFPYTIGKTPTYSDYLLQDNSVSRVHACFTEKDEQIWLMDLNSTNGTFHNGLRLQPNQKVELEPEDEIQFGKVTFIYR